MSKCLVSKSAFSYMYYKLYLKYSFFSVIQSKLQWVNLFFSDTPGVCEGSIEISKITEESCTLSWKPPLEDGGDEISHYIVERRDTNRLNWVIMHAECKELTCIITGLFKNTEYLFRVRGVNKYGSGVYLQSEPMVARNTFSKCNSQQCCQSIISQKCQRPNRSNSFTLKQGSL